MPGENKSLHYLKYWLLKNFWNNWSETIFLVHNNSLEPFAEQKQNKWMVTAIRPI